MVVSRARRRRILWTGGCVICSILIVGGVMYAFDISWSHFEAPFVSDSQLSSQSLVTNSMSVILPSYVVSYAANRLSNHIDSFFRLPPYPHSFYRMVMSWLRFLWSHFLVLNPRMKAVALCVVHYLGVATVNHLFFLGWAATRYLLSLLQLFLANVIHYFYPPPPPPAQSGHIYGNVSFHGQVTFLSSVRVQRNLVYMMPRRDENE